MASRDLVTYDAEKAQYVCEEIAKGRTLSEIMVTDSDKVPSRPTWYRWLVLYPELKKLYDAARELSASAFEDEMLDMARTLKGKNDFTQVKTTQYQIALQQLRWSASRRDPSRYGEKQSVNLMVPIQINTTLDMGPGAGGTSTAEYDNVYALQPGAARRDPDDEDPQEERLEDPSVEDFLAPAKVKRPAAFRQPRLPKGHKTPIQLRQTLNRMGRPNKNKRVPNVKRDDDEPAPGGTGDGGSE
jgi:hypothetical protein